MKLAIRAGQLAACLILSACATTPPAEPTPPIDASAEQQAVQAPAPMHKASATAAPHPTLIPREVIFGNPDRTALQVSPDGRNLSWLAPLDGVLNVYVAPAAAPEQARTRRTSHPRTSPPVSPDAECCDLCDVHLFIAGLRHTGPPLEAVAGAGVDE